jgi:phosphoesterase RecJ-like protein
MKEDIQTLSPQIWALVSQSQRVLINLHVGTDWDSLCSSFGLKLLLESLGKKADIFSAEPVDKEIVRKKYLLPGFDEIKYGKFSDLDLKKYDLFICPDSETPGRISRDEEIRFPLSIPTIVIDHHVVNSKMGEINLVVTDGICTSEIIYNLAKTWPVKITKECALCLYIGIWADTGQFIYQGTTSSDSYRAAADLIDIGEIDFPRVYFELSTTPSDVLKCTGFIESRAKSLFNHQVILTSATFADLAKFSLDAQSIEMIKNTVCHNFSFAEDAAISVFIYQKGIDWYKISFRSNNLVKFKNVRDIAKRFPGGGGLNMAAGADLRLPFNEVKKQVLEKIRETYPDLGDP